MTQKHSSFLLACVLALGGSYTQQAAAQGAATAEARIMHASQPIEGVSSFRADVRDRVASDAALIDLFADVLEGRRTTSIPWDTTTIVWWLAESGNPKYLPIFLRYARSDQEYDLYQKALYGLARHARIPAARARLLELDAAQDPNRLFMLDIVLAHVNDEPTRAVLRQMSERGRARSTVELRTRVLRRRGKPEGQGRWPCVFASEHFGETKDGSFGCERGAPSQ